MDAETETLIPTIGGGFDVDTLGREPQNGGNGIGYDDTGSSYTLTKTDGHAVAYRTNAAGQVMAQEGIAAMLNTATDPCTQILHAQMQVRRLTPTECARLQGFPDDYLPQVPGYSDSAAYKALGNSMAVNVMQLIGRRIQMVEKCDV